MSRPHPPRLFVPIFLFAIAGPGVVCLTGDTHPETTPAPSAGIAAPGTAGLRAYLNPETGKVGVAASTVATPLDPDTENALRRDAVGLSEEHRADGTVLLDLDGRFQSVAMVHRTADGRLFLCTDDPARATKTIQGDIASPATAEVK